MRKRIYLGLATLIIVIMGAGLFLFVSNQTKKPHLEQEHVQQQSAQEGAEVAQDGHFHGDGTFHSDIPPEPMQQDDTPVEPKVKYTAPKGVVTKPNFPIVDPKADPVKEAYKRLEYIKKNPYAWGGVHSERATELIAELLPAEVAANHNEGDEEDLLIDELCEQGDPRAAEALIALMCDGGVIGLSMIDALVEIGPPAVPYILPYVRENFVMTAIAVDVLGRIGARYRDDLGGIVDHIIIPKLKVIADDEDNERYESPAPSWAREALDRFQ